MEPQRLYVVYYMYEEDTYDYHHGEPIILGLYTTLEKARAALSHVSIYGEGCDSPSVLTKKEEAAIAAMSPCATDPEHAALSATVIRNRYYWCVLIDVDNPRPEYNSDNDSDEGAAAPIAPPQG
jgi:hypothetical protein